MRVWNHRDANTPPDAVYVGRGTPWGNPFVMKHERERDEVCDRFEREILPTLDVRPLVGKHLICWCAPKRCHADALLRAAQGIEAETATTAKQGVVHESPVGATSADAPKEGSDNG